MASPLPEPFDLIDVLGDGEVLTCLAEFRGSRVLVHVLPADPTVRDRLITRINRLPRNPDFLDRLDHQGHSLIVTRHKPELEKFEAWLDEHSPEEAGPEAPAADEPGEMTRLVLSIKEAVEEEDAGAEEEDDSATQVMESFHTGVELQDEESPEEDEGATQVMESFHAPPEPEPAEDDKSTRVMESFDPFTPPGDEDDDDSTRAIRAPDRDTVERPAQPKTEPALRPPAAFSEEVTQEREKPAEKAPAAQEGEKRKTRLFLSAEPPAGSSSAATSGTEPPKPASPDASSSSGGGESARSGGGSSADKTAVKRKPTLEPASTGPDPRVVGAVLLAVALVVAVVVFFLG